MNSEKIATYHEIAKHLVMAASTVSLYAADHPQVNRLCAAAHQSILKAIASSPELGIFVIGDDLVIEEIPIKGGYYSMRLARLLNDRNIGHLKIIPAVTLTEIRQLVVNLAKQKPGKDVARSTENIRYGNVEIRHSDDSGQKIAGFEDLSEAELATLVNTFDKIANRQSFDVSAVTNIINGFVGAFQTNFNPLLALVPLREMDEYTFTHSLDVCVLNIVQGMALGIDGSLLADIGVAGMLHDVGKIFMDIEILNKPGKLDASELEHMRQHPRRGAEYLLSCPGIPRLAILSSFEHHMKFNLSGYPSVPVGWNLAIPSQMTMISDIFDALRTRRVYHTPSDFKKIEGILLDLSASELNPFLTRNFLKVMHRLSLEL